MFDVRYFHRALYIVLLLGLLGYSIALESPLHFLVGLLAVLPNAYLARRGRFPALPRFVASVAALVLGFWSALGVLRGSLTPLMGVSQWLFVLLLVTLWSRPTNRSYAQMLVMSLVLMVAGAINTASFVYGIILSIYLFISLYCCLLFHLKVETEMATQAYALSAEQVNARALRHSQGLFSQSMRRLTLLIASFSVILGILVFLFFPRAKTTGAMMQMQVTQQAALTGISDRISFNQVAKITQNPDIVARVALTENDKPLPPTDLYLRGLTLDVYSGNYLDRPGLNWQWIRSSRISQTTRAYHITSTADQPLVRPAGTRQIRQSVLLQPNGTSALFAMAGLQSLRADHEMEVLYQPKDATLRVSEAPRVPFRYEVVSSGELPAVADEPDDVLQGPPFADSPMPPGSWLPYGYVDEPTKSQIDPKVAEYARKPEVSGKDAKGLLYLQRGKSEAAQPLDETIARNICRHLQSKFTYTLDLTDTTRHPNEDPLAAFLYRYKRGHCEYFAGAMTLLCQSLGLQARVVVGFHADGQDYNSSFHYYVVKQSNAHAWVEVLTTHGWVSFDPTASELYSNSTPPGGLIRKLRDVFDYLQYRWASAIVTYDDHRRLDLIQGLNFNLDESIASLKSRMQALREYLHSENAYLLSSRLIILGIIGSLLMLLLAVVIFVAEKRRLLRRAERIGITSLQVGDQLRLARQLGFYDDLILLLAKNQIQRPTHMTPMEFANSLGFLPAESYQQVIRLTRIFYRVRYGGHHLTPAQRRHLLSVIASLHQVLTPHSSKGILVAQQ